MGSMNFNQDLKLQQHGSMQMTSTSLASITNVNTVLNSGLNQYSAQKRGRGMKDSNSDSGMDDDDDDEDSDDDSGTTSPYRTSRKDEKDPAQSKSYFTHSKDN